VKSYPALDIRAGSLDRLYAALDDLSPTAVEERDDGLRAFFLTPADRDAARRALAPEFPNTPVDVPDDDWARRSQEGLQPITIGRITIWPTTNPLPTNPLSTNPLSTNPLPTNPQSPIPNHLALVIAPSTGFGTGHHATTRLCLAALQRLDLGGKIVLDVGTGSGVLAIAARLLGAAQATGIDFDPDAIQAARDNLERNPAISQVSFRVADVNHTPLPCADVVTANLTGALLARSAATLFNATTAGGVLILSGVMTAERDDVLHAFSAGLVVSQEIEDDWIGLVVKKP
jgi:ribosomal protein L11 methyltransferase